MRILQDAIEQTLHCLPAQAATALIGKKLAAQGVKLSGRELDRLTDQMLEGTSDTFRLHRWKWWEQRENVGLEFTPEDIGQIEHTSTDFVENHLPKIIQKGERGPFADNPIRSQREVERRSSPAKARDCGFQKPPVRSLESPAGESPTASHDLA
jgi:hypothetical protein